MATYPGDILVPRSVTAKGENPEQEHSLVEGMQMGLTPCMATQRGNRTPGSAAPRMSHCDQCPTVTSPCDFPGVSNGPGGVELPRLTPQPHQTTSHKCIGTVPTAMPHSWWHHIPPG